MKKLLLLALMLNLCPAEEARAQGSVNSSASDTAKMVTPRHLSATVSWPGSASQTLTLRNDSQKNLAFQINSRSAVSNLKIGLIQIGVSVNAVRTRLMSLGYRNISLLPPTSDLAKLRNYDVIYLPSSWAQFGYSSLQARSADYLAYVQEGGGLFVDQPHTDWSPSYQVTPGLLPYPITFAHLYDRWDWPPVMANATHEITQGLRPEEMPGPGDQITALAPEYEILVRSAYTATPTLVITRHGRGRILIQTANPGLNVRNPFSNAAYMRMVEWVGKKNMAWLSYAPNAGTVAPGDSLNISVQFNSKHAIPGFTYNAELFISTNDRDAAIVTVPAQMTVNPEPYFVAVDPAVFSADGYGTDAVIHPLRIRNYGQNSDSYHLTFAGNRWNAQFFDSTGAQPITRTPNIAGGGHFKVLVKVTIDSLAAKGAQDTVRVVAVSVGNPDRLSSAKLTTTSRGFRIHITGLPFTDDFSNPSLDSLKWFGKSGSVVVDARGANEPSPPNSLRLNGTSEVRSQVIDLSGKSAVLMRYAYEMGGDGEAAEWNEALRLDYRDAAGNWINLKRHTSGTRMTSYASQTILLPLGAYHRNFAFRFLATSHIFGDWFVDDVTLFPPPDIMVTHAPDPFHFTLMWGDSSAGAITIKNIGTKELKFFIAEQTAAGEADKNWLAYSPNSGTVAPGNNVTINAWVRTKNLLPNGNYQKTILISRKDPDAVRVQIPVALRINPDPYFVRINPNVSRAEGFAGHIVTHALRIHNRGQNSDSYHLTVTGNRWNTQFFDSTFTRPISRTPTVAAGGNLKILVKVTIDSLESLGTQETVRVIAASVGNPARSSPATLTTMSRGPGPQITKLPFIDQFHGPTLDSFKWFSNLGPAVVNTRGANEPSPPNSLNLNGTDEARSQSIDLSGKARVLIRYAYEMGGRFAVGTARQSKAC